MRTLRPWSQRAKELEPTEDPYADYAAWREWFGKQKMGTSDMEDTGEEILESTEGSTFGDTLLYGICCDCADHFYNQTLAGKVERLRWKVYHWLQDHRPSRIVSEWKSVRSLRLFCKHRWWHDFPYPYKRHEAKEEG